MDALDLDGAKACAIQIGRITPLVGATLATAGVSFPIPAVRNEERSRAGVKAPSEWRVLAVRIQTTKESRSLSIRHR